MQTLEPARWKDVQNLFHQADKMSNEDQSKFLQDECKDDPQLIAAVKEMLTASKLSQTLSDIGPGDLASAVLDSPVPMVKSFGPYQIEAELGQGGMGVVYLASRVDFGTQVAIKVLRDASLSSIRRDLFQQEQQMLAQLNHPAIARIYDADIFADGTPYFVMEYVPGVNIVEYCRSQKQALSHKLMLFRQVCSAVLFAHRQLLIHRDLKPSNIMVSVDELSDVESVKLLDFGIAKRISGAVSDPVLADHRMLTPGYAAPEQIRDEPMGVAVDVYALGVILYELLSGDHPYELSGLTPAEAETRILQTDPPKLSAKMAASKQTQTTPSIKKRHWADLDALCMTAMHKDQGRRYATVDALIRDLDRFTQSEPLEARPDSFSYRFGKYVFRNCKTLASVMAFVAVLVLTTTFYTDRLSKARDAALIEADRSENIQTFWLGLIASNEMAGISGDYRVSDMLKLGVRNARLLDAYPERQAELFQTLGEVYRDSGDLEQASSLLNSAINLRTKLLGPEHPATAYSRSELALVMKEQGNFAEASVMAREAFRVIQGKFSLDHPKTAEAMAILGGILEHQSEYVESLQLLNQAAAIQQRYQNNYQLSYTLTTLARAYHNLGDFAKSDAINRRLLDIDAELYGKNHTDYATDLINLAATRKSLGDTAEAERLYREALEINRQFHGETHPVTASNLSLLGRVLVLNEKYIEANQVLLKALEIRRKVFGEAHFRVGLTLSALGLLALQQNDLNLSERYYKDALKIYIDSQSKPEWIAASYSSLASVYYKKGNLIAAEAGIVKSLALYQNISSELKMGSVIAGVKLGNIRLTQKRFLEAKETLLNSYEFFIKTEVNPSSQWITQAREGLIEVYLELGDHEAAERFRNP